jgi:hypothetical protein
MSRTPFPVAATTTAGRPRQSSPRRPADDAALPPAVVAIIPSGTLDSDNLDNSEGGRNGAENSGRHPQPGVNGPTRL